MQSLLEEQGWEVSIAGSAEAVLASLTDPFPDLFIVSYSLPGMRGDDFCRCIRSNLGTREIPLLIMTGSVPEIAEIRSLDNGANGYIAKSGNPDTLLLRIRALLRAGAEQEANLQDSGFRSASTSTGSSALRRLKELKDWSLTTWRVSAATWQP